MNGNGSVQKENIEIKSTPENRKIVEEIVEQLTAEGWVWFTDYYVEYDPEIEVQIYNDKLRPILRQILMEKLV